jgi:hypothetical protein
MTIDMGGEVLRHAMKHVLPVYVHFEREAKLHAALFTSTVIAYRGHWLLLTAGHCLTDVQRMLNQGWTLKRCRFIDALSPGTPSDKLPMSVPYAYEATPPLILYDDERGIDYGAKIIDRLTCETLAAHGIEAIDERYWHASAPAGALKHVIVGVSGELSSASDHVAKVVAVNVPVEEVEDVPDGLAASALRWYGRVLDSGKLTSLEGISGGPLFSITMDEDGDHLSLWLRGIQSAQPPQFRNRPFVAAMLLQPLADWIASQVDASQAPKAK